jgi:hypothetical protein
MLSMDGNYNRISRMAEKTVSMDLSYSAKEPTE